MKKKILPLPLLYLSPFFYETKDEYDRCFHNVSCDNTWNDWISYFLNAVETQSYDILSRIQRINSLISSWKIEPKRGRSNHIIKNVIIHLAENPYVTTRKIMKRVNIQLQTAQRVIKTLEEHGILTYISHEKNNHLYCATQILDILENKVSHNKEVNYIKKQNIAHM